MFLYEYTEFISTFLLVVQPLLFLICSQCFCFLNGGSNLFFNVFISCMLVAFYSCLQSGMLFLVRFSGSAIVSIIVRSASLNLAYNHQFLMKQESW